MTNPFKAGDKVHHVHMGSVKVERTGKDARDVYIDPGKGEAFRWVHVGTLSFQPWPKPDHVRPQPFGFYLVKVPDAHIVYEWRNDGRWYHPSGRELGLNVVAQMTLLQYLGTEISTNL